MEKSIKNFTDLEVWQKAHAVVIEIYVMTKRFPKDEMYGLTSQLRRAASSVTANIAEGFSRFSYRDRKRFYYNSRGSLSEAQNHLLLAKDLNYLDAIAAQDMIRRLEKIKMMLNGLIRSTQDRIINPHR